MNACIRVFDGPSYRRSCGDEMNNDPLSEAEWVVYRSAITSVAAHQYENARRELKPVSDAHPDLHPVMLLYAKTLVETRRFSDASHVIDRLLVRHSDDVEVLLYHSLLCYHKGDLITYRETLERIITLNPPEHRLFVLIAKSQLFRQKKDFESEYTTLRDALNISPDDFSVLSAISYPMIKTGRLDEAEQVVATLLKVYPDSVDNLVSLADVEWERGNADKAEELLKKARVSAPNSLDVGSRLNRIYWRQGRVREVINAAWGCLFPPSNGAD